MNGGILGKNLFAYCGNNPINRVDPTGKSFWDNLKFFGKKALEVGTAVLGIAGAVTIISTAFTGTIMSGGAGAVSIPAAAALATECLAMAGAAVSALGITLLAVAEGGEVIPEKQIEKNLSKNDSDVWNKSERVKGSDMKKSGKGRNTKYYEWDHTHNDIEVYNRYGEHLGSMNPTTGEMYKGPVAGRTINVL